jgi:superfamily II RNA helicase
LSHRPKEIKSLLDLSFAAFQQAASDFTVQRSWDEASGLLKSMLPASNCDMSDPYEILEYMQRRLDLKKTMKRLSVDIKGKRRMEYLRPYLQKGRLFKHKDKETHILFYSYMDKGMLICVSHSIEKKVRMRKGKIRLKKIPFTKISRLYNYRINLPEDYTMNDLQIAIDSIDRHTLKILNTESFKKVDDSEIIKAMEKEMKHLPCEDCRHLPDCHGKKNRELHRILKTFKFLSKRMEGTSEGLWLSFKRHLRFLKETNFVDEKDSLTSDGVWASNLRLDQPLLIAEAIRNGVFGNLEPEIMSGCIAPFVWDKDQDVEIQRGSNEDLKVMEDAFYRVLESMENIRRLKVVRGFDNPPILFWPAAALFLWSKGSSWDQLLSSVPIGEGDMASMIVRTADHLRQVANLKETHPELAIIARRAIDLILREPVLVP